MLYERWREIAREFANELALVDATTERRWTFNQLNQESEQTGETGRVVFPSGNSPAFVIAILRAWRHGQTVCPLEPGQSIPSAPVPPDDIVHLKLTSATTGPPRLVAFQPNQLAADAANIVATMGLRHDWPNVAFISLAHSYGFSNLITPLLLHGIPLVLGGTPLPETFRRVAASFSAMTVPAVPALWRAWLEAGVLDARVRLAISAGAPLPLALEGDIYTRCGIKIHNFYGASECGGIAYDPSPSPRSDALCVGEPLQNVILTINAAGCLEVRGPNVGEGYWPHDPSAALENGCYRTSDLAEITERGVLLKGRSSDIINVAGRKISPETIEQLLLQHELVRDCLVFGVPSTDPHRGETIVACVVADAAVTVAQLRRFLLERSESWQVPREVWFVDSLQVNQRGKLSRPEWRHRFLSRSP